MEPCDSYVCVLDIIDFVGMRAWDIHDYTVIVEWVIDRKRLDHTQGMQKAGVCSTQSVGAQRVGRNKSEIFLIEPIAVTQMRSTKACCSSAALAVGDVVLVGQNLFVRRNVPSGCATYKVCRQLCVQFLWKRVHSRHGSMYM